MNELWFIHTETIKEACKKSSRHRLARQCRGTCAVSQARSCSSLSLLRQSGKVEQPVVAGGKTGRLGDDGVFWVVPVVMII